jgi:hypothetical protein
MGRGRRIPMFKTMRRASACWLGVAGLTVLATGITSVTARDAREATLYCRETFIDSNGVRRYYNPYLLKVDFERSVVTQIDYTGRTEYRSQATITSEFVEWIQTSPYRARRALNRITGDIHSRSLENGHEKNGNCEVREPKIK